MAGSRPTNAEARAFHNRFDSYGDALKSAGNGGPSRAAYDAGVYNDDVYKAEHPRYPDYHYPDDKAEDTRIQTMLAGRDFYGAQPQFVIGDREMDYLMKRKRPVLCWISSNSWKIQFPEELPGRKNTLKKSCLDGTSPK